MPRRGSGQIAAEETDGGRNARGAILKPRQPASRQVLYSLACLAASGFASGCKDARSPAGVQAGPTTVASASKGNDPTPLERVVAACVEAMVRSTCQVMAGSGASSSANVIFVAGVGPVDAAAYRTLRESGEGMCEVVRGACRTDWEGPQCKASRALWPSSTGG